ncbi:maleate cis-trans isomerase family protein [Afifella pfennigii]|uniref:maleate cis-trans isomerase family protein n=1 Tax=Afifella pfennigii TaxID=209897 RepID=UPI00047E7A49|nr:hypothetical protein [Afifella pfennigii]
MQSDRASQKLRIGLVFPGGGCEGDYYRFEAASGEAARVYFSRARHGVVDGADHHPDALRQTARVEWIGEAARRLSAVPLDVLVWACTSGSFINGRRFAEEQAAALARTTGVAATSTSLAFPAAAAALGVRRVSVLATYPEETAAIFLAFLSEFGIEALNMKSLGFDSGWNSSEFATEALVEAAAGAMAPDAEALLIPDTALPTFAAIEALEARLQRPVLSANAVSLWHAMQIADRPIPVSGLGRLLAGQARG